MPRRFGVLYFLTSSCCLHLEGDPSHMCDCCGEWRRPWEFSAALALDQRNNTENLIRCLTPGKVT